MSKPDNTLPNLILLLGLVVGIATTFSGRFMPKAMAESPAVVSNPVNVIGSTKDGKYPIYDLSGELLDVNYRSSRSIIYQPDDLVGRVNFIDMKDVDHGYTCDFVCKDKEGHIVGLNPQRAKQYMVKDRWKNH